MNDCLEFKYNINYNCKWFLSFELVGQIYKFDGNRKEVVFTLPPAQTHISSSTPTTLSTITGRFEGETDVETGNCSITNIWNIFWLPYKNQNEIKKQLK